MTISLTSSSTSGVVRTLGGELVSFKAGGLEYVWQGDPAHWNGQAPILFPVCCSAKENADPSTVETLQNRGVETYYMYNGDVTIVSDGKTLSCSQTAKE